jgi:shikimate kinase
MMQIRRPTYERLATFTVLTTGREPDDIAAEIAHRLDRRAPAKDRGGEQSE